MPYRKVITFPSADLRKKSTVITDFGESLEALLIDLEDTLRVESGSGLAASQVGIFKKVLIIDTSHFEFTNPDSGDFSFENENLWAVINPVISSCTGSTLWEEGCLSVPGFTEKVKRKK